MPAEPTTGHSRRWRLGTVAVALAVGATAAVIVGIVTADSPDAPDQSAAVEVPLSTSDWEPGDDAALAQLVGTVMMRDGCVYVQTKDGPVDVVWPAGYTVETSDDPARIYGPGHVLVAEVGRRVSTGGSASPREHDLVCRAAKGSPFYIMDDLTKAG